VSIAPIPVIDLFAGPGGLGEGFESGGRFHIGLSVECDPHAHRTLLLRSFFRQFGRNREPDAYYDYVKRRITREELFAKYPKEAVAAARIAKLARLGETPPAMIDSMVESALGRSTRKTGNWVLIGGPPCQAYSLVGRSRRTREDRAEFEKDTRHYLYREYLRILAKHRPAVFVMENVKGILSASLGGSRIFSRICDDLSGAGYSLFGLSGLPTKSGDLFSGGGWNPAAFLIRAEEHGIPQKRHRVFILGIRNDLVDSDWTPETFALSKSDAPTVHETIGRLPKLWSALSSPDPDRKAWLKARKTGFKAAETDRTPAQKVPKDDRGQFFVEGNMTSVFNPEWYRGERVGGALNHETRTHIAEDIARYAFAAGFAAQKGRSPSIHEFPERLLPEHRNVHEPDGSVPFADRFRVQLRDQPSTTVTSHISKDGHYYIHPDPDQARSLTVREAARLQTFPDTYFFEGPRTQQYHQVGNAVPPLLARQIAEIVTGKILQ
jgi:DNA (cytosine-5)-methyltransferase 1